MPEEIAEREVVLHSGGYKAMILAAGLGTRLGHLTSQRPKALVEWKGVPLLEHVILKLRDSGFTEIIINVHHHAGMIVDFVREKKDFGIRIEFSHEKKSLLDTGGGIARAAWFLKDGPFLVHNVDIISSIDLNSFMAAHLRKGALVTMAVKQRDTSRSLLMNAEGYLGGWRNNRTGETILTDEDCKELIPIAFSAIHVIDPEVLKLFPPQERFPIMPFYLDLAKKHRIYLHRHDADSWMDMGKPESFDIA